MTWLKRYPSFHALVALLAGCLCVAASDLAAQQATRAQQNRDAVVPQTMTLPQGELLELRVRAPREVRVSDSYDYRIDVTNTSSDIVLHNVVIEQRPQQGFQVEKAELLPADRQSSSNSRAQQNQQRQRRDQQVQQASQQQTAQNGAEENSESAPESDEPEVQQATANLPAGERQNPQEQQQREEQQRRQQQQKQAEQQSQQGQGSSSKNEWTIDQLSPGETRTIQITASSDNEGASGTCLLVKSYQTALCLQTRFVKPELELVKQAPDTAGLCQEIEYAYYIKNEGSGETGPLTIRDQLAEGLVTASGEKELEFTVDNLMPGDTRKFVASLRATQAGEFASRATVKAEKGGEARSNSVKTVVQKAELAVALDGPDVEYSQRPITYTAKVSNTGDTIVENVDLVLYGNQNLQLARVGEVKASDRPVEGSAGNRSQPTPADPQREATTAAEAKAGSPQGGEQATEELRSWNLDRLEPGETRVVRYSVRPGEAKLLQQRLVARYVCAPGDEERRAIEATAITQTEIVTLPALLVAVVDEVDPVKVGEEVVYQIVVENQGDAPDQEIQLTAELPEGLEFASIEGETQGKNEGQTVTIDPLQELKPGERAVWHLRATVKQPAEAILKVDMTSKNQEEKVRSEEPTRLVQAEE